MIQNSLTHLHGFARIHDELPAFHILYAICTFIAAAMFSLGTFAIIIIAHMLLDVIKYRDVHAYSWKDTVLSVIHESVLEVALFCIALLVSIFFHSSVGFVHFSGALRIELSIVQFFGIILPKYFILEHAIKVFSHVHHYLLYIHPTVGKRRWTMLDKCYLGIIFSSVLLLLSSPFITQADPTVIAHVVWYELQPFRL